MLPPATCVGQLSVVCSSDCSTGANCMRAGIDSNETSPRSRKTIFVDTIGIETGVVESED